MVSGVFQFAPVNFTTPANPTLSGLTVPSVGSLELSAMVTSAVGWLVRTIVKVAVPPASVVVRPEVGVTVMPAASLSVLVTATSARVDPVVDQIGAVRRGGDDRVGDVAVVQDIVGAGHGDGLRACSSWRGVNVRLGELTVPSVGSLGLTRWSRPPSAGW